MNNISETPEELRNFKSAARPYFGTQEQLIDYAVEMMLIENPNADKEALYKACKE